MSTALMFEALTSTVHVYDSGVLNINVFSVHNIQLSFPHSIASGFVRH